MSVKVLVSEYCKPSLNWQGLILVSKFYVVTCIVCIIVIGK